MRKKSVQSSENNHSNHDTISIFERYEAVFTLEHISENNTIRNGVILFSQVEHYAFPFLHLLLESFFFFCSFVCIKRIVDLAKQNIHFLSLRNHHLSSDSGTSE